MRDALTDLCLMDPRHVIAVTDPGSPSQFLDAVNQSAAQAEDVLLLYYIGHGLVSLANEFFLATTATTDREAARQDLPQAFAHHRSSAAGRVPTSSRAGACSGRARPPHD